MLEEMPAGARSSTDSYAQGLESSRGARSDSACFESEAFGEDQISCFSETQMRQQVFGFKPPQRQLHYRLVLPLGTFDVQGSSSTSQWSLLRTRRV